MIIRKNDIDWLRSQYPNLYFDASKQVVAGELNFCAEYDRNTSKLKIGSAGSLRPQTLHLCDVYEVEVKVGPKYISPKSGWPKVYEVGGKLAKIKEKTHAALKELHFFPDRSCCLGIRFTRDEHLTIGRFLQELVVPFFFRLSYVNKQGLAAAQRDLWGEHSHTKQGFAEHFFELMRYAQTPHSKYALCPCGSNRSYSDCCLNDVKLIAEITQPHICIFRRYYTISKQQHPILSSCSKCHLQFCPLVDVNRH